MELSRHNIIGKIADSDNYYIINPLSRQADILEPDVAEKLQKNQWENPEELEEKGYLVEAHQEEKLYKEEYLKFLDEREDEEVQVFFVPSYQCNFNCSYCYQSGYDPLKNDLTPEVLEAFFHFLDTELAGRRKYITIFGGEPLLPSKVHKENIRGLLKAAADRDLGVALVTNGYSLKQYLDLLKDSKIREIQVTLDGTEEVHNKRRPLGNGAGTFQEIVEGIDQALDMGFPVNLRMVIDRENIQELPQLAGFAVARGWTSKPNFKTQLGRNYELHYCQSNQKRLFNRLDMYQDIYQMIQEYPEILEFHRPAFSISRFLWERGEMPDPLFDSCPGTKSEWALDYTGRIYSCTATVGKKEEELGTFFPELKWNEGALEDWQDRDVTSIDKCRNCNLQLACGGGCAAVAKNQNGALLSQDCRPVDGLLSLGISAYFEKKLLD